MNLPSEAINRTMYVANSENNDIFTLFATHESKSGKSILTDHGKVHRTYTKKIRIFNSYDFALLFIKKERKQYDEEYDELLKKLKLVDSNRT